MLLGRRLAAADWPPVAARATETNGWEGALGIHLQASSKWHDELYYRIFVPAVVVAVGLLWSHYGRLDTFSGLAMSDNPQLRRSLCGRIPVLLGVSEPRVVVVWVGRQVHY